MFDLPRLRQRLRQQVRDGLKRIPGTVESGCNVRGDGLVDEPIDRGERQI